MGKRSTPKATEAAPAAMPNFDTELDALFSKAKAAAPAATAQAPPTSSLAKRKRPEEDDKRAGSSKNKKAASPQPAVESTSDDEDSDEDFDEDASLDLSEIEKEMEEQGLTRGDDEEDEEEFEDCVQGEDEEDGEEAVGSGGGDDDDDVDDDDDDDDDENAPPPVHESLSAKDSSMSRKIKRTLEAREEESKKIRDKRSIFVGNIPLAAVQSKSITRDLKKQVVAMSPYPFITRVDALRYRSVAFSVPTGDYSANSEESEKKRARSRAYKDAIAELDAEESGEGKARQVYLNPKQKRKVAYINQDINEKAKSVNAYITLDKLTDQDYQKLASNTGCTEEQARKITSPVLAALIAARLDDTTFEGRHLRVDVAEKLELSELVQSGLDKFLSKSSSAEHPFSVALTRVLGGSGGKSREENAKTLFVGNMDFEADEEDVRALFEGLVREERGVRSLTSNSTGGPASVLERLSLPSMTTVSEDATALEQPTWVTSVRLIRDPATQMGKGFGYIRFSDEECVDELMAIWEADEAFLKAVKPGKGGSSTQGGLNSDGSRRDFKRRIKLNKRPLRLSRCKASSGGGGANGKKGKKATDHPKRDGKSDQPSSSSSSTSTPTTPPRQRRRSMGAPTPGGTSPSTTSSSTGQIANPPPKRPRTSEDLTRLALKRNDPDRQAKRLAKKENKKKKSRLAGEDAVAGGKRDKVKLDIKKAQKARSLNKAKASRARGPGGGKPSSHQHKKGKKA